MKWGVLLVNSGTPASLATRDVRAFLAGLLGDPRVVELPRLLWWPILHGIILRVRPRASAKKYAAIWTPEGSPLAVQSEALRRRTRGSRCARATCRWRWQCSTPAAPRFRRPSIRCARRVPKASSRSRCSRSIAEPPPGAVFDQVSGALRTTALRSGAEIRRRTITTTLPTSTRSPPACRNIGASSASRAIC